MKMRLSLRNIFLAALMAVGVSAHAVTILSVLPEITVERVVEFERPFFNPISWEFTTEDAPIAFVPHGYRPEDEDFALPELF